MNFKPNPKKLYPSLSANSLHSLHRNKLQNKNFSRARNTDYTEDRVSERSQSQKIYEGSQIQQEVPDYEKTPHQRPFNFSKDDDLIRNLTEKQQKVIELRERLKNMHHFYRIRIEEQRNKNLQRNQIFIGIIEELQKGHNDKIINMQKSLQEIDEEKNDLGYVDNRMGTIKNTIQEILVQSKELKGMNQVMEKQILEKQHVLKEKQSHYMTLKDETDELRNKLQNFERLRLKENKRNKEMIDLIDETF